MKPIYIYSNWICDLASRINGFQVDGLEGIPFIAIVRPDAGEILKNHEAIHFNQMLECLIIFWYLIYAINYIKNIFSMNHYNSYMNVCFEQEAYKNQNNLDYLKTRKLFAWRG